MSTLFAGFGLTVDGRCSTCAARWPAATPPVLVVVRWVPESGAAEIWPVRRRHASQIGGGGPYRVRTGRRDLDDAPLARGQRLDVRCPRCKVGHEVRPSTVLRLAETARRQRASDFLLP